MMPTTRHSARPSGMCMGILRAGSGGPRGAGNATPRGGGGGFGLALPGFGGGGGGRALYLSPSQLNLIGCS